MKQMLPAGAIACGLLLAGTAAHASWGTCGGCHNGSLAQSREQLLAKYTTAEALISAAQDSDSPMMSRIKEDLAALQVAASELGLGSEEKER